MIKHKKFKYLFWIQFLGALNDNLLKNAFVIFVTFKGIAAFGVPPAQMVSLTGGLFILPFFIFSSLAGQCADRFEKSGIIRIVKGIEIALAAVAAVGWITSNMGLLLAVVFGFGVHSTFFGPVKYSLLPQILDERDLLSGNAWVEAGTFLAILLGTLLGGMLIVHASGPVVVSVIVLTIAIAGFFVSRKLPSVPRGDPDLPLDWNIVRSTLALIRTAKRDRAVFLSILGNSWFWFLGAAVLSLIPSYCKDVLQVSEGWVTGLLACFSIGIGVGSFLCERLSKRNVELGLVPFGSIGISLFLLDLGIHGSTMSMRVVCDLFFISVFSGLFVVPLYSMIQERSELRARSRVIAANNVINAVFMVAASMLLVVGFQAQLNLLHMFMVLAGLNAVVAIYIYTLVPEFLLRWIAWMVAHFMYRLRVVGEDHVPARGAALLVCNHVSFVDWLVIAAGIHRPVRFVMHYSFGRAWWMRGFMRRAKIIPIAGAKENAEILKQAMEQIARELKDGNIVCIFPEGQISKDGTLGEFKTGVEHILARTPVPVIPMALHGLWGSVFSYRWGKPLAKRPRRFWSRILLEVGSAVDPRPATAGSLRQAVLHLKDPCKVG